MYMQNLNLYGNMFSPKKCSTYNPWVHKLKKRKKRTTNSHMEKVIFNFFILVLSLSSFSAKNSPLRSTSCPELT